MIESKLPGIGTTIFTTMSSLAKECGAINLSQGFPDFDAPTALLEALGQCAGEGHNQYAPMAGALELRQAIAAQLLRYRKVHCDPEQEVTVVPGATEGIFCAITACVRPGDEAILLDPCYDSYEPAITLAGGRAVHVPLENPDFSIDWQRVEQAISTRTRVIIINSPHNPTGMIMSEKDMLKLQELVDSYGLLVISDEVYEHLVYDGEEHHSVLQFAGLRQRSFAVFSFGKTFSVTGWKTGYCVAPPELSAELRKVHQFVSFVAVTPVQLALARFISDEPEFPAGLAAFYQAKRDLFCDALSHSRFRLQPSRGTYFQLLEYSTISDEPDTHVCQDWTRRHGVASIPISIFSQAPREHQAYLRFCFAKTDAVLLRAAEILCKI